MSESTQFTDITTTDHKLMPPRSLHGIDDAEAIWNTITRRFPNAAPLFHEMETVIERAEDLLQQFKAPCTQDIDTSSSFHTPYSRESNTTISTVSDIESFAEETNNAECPDSTENIETQLMIHDIHKEQVDLKSHCRHSEQSIQWQEKYSKDYLNSFSASLDDVLPQHSETYTINMPCHNVQNESNVNLMDNNSREIDTNFEEKLIDRVAEKTSLEGWTKVADNAFRNWQSNIQDIDLSNHNNTKTQSDIGKDINNELRINNNNDKYDRLDYECHRNDDINEGEIKLQNNNIESCRSVSTNRPSPFTVLEEYAERCNRQTQYETSTSNRNRFVVKGDLCGFNATSSAETEDLAKNKVAAEILWLLTKHQIDESKLSTFGLSELSKEEMLESMAFNTNKLECPSHKLYKLCLEQGESIPRYSIQGSEMSQGFMYKAECAALGYVGVGKARRETKAKIEAAQNLYQKYNKIVK